MSVIPNSINVSNPIAPNFTDDTFALFDPIYGIGGLREVANLTERNNISAERLRVGMLVYVTSENQFYRLVSSSEDPVSFVTTTNWENVIFLNNNAQTISGVKSFQSGDFDNLIINYVLGAGEAKIKFGSNGYLLCNELDPIYTLGGVTPITLDAYNSAIGLNNLSVSFNQYDLATYFGNKGEFVQFGLKNKFIHFYDYNSVLDQIEPNTQYNFKSGVSGSIPVDSEVVHITGDETISGQKTFKTRPTVNGSGVLLVGDNLGTSPSLSDTINVQTGNFYQLNTNNLVVSGTATFNNIDLSEIDSVYVSGADVLLNYSGSKFFKISQTGIISNLGVNIGKQNINNSNDTSFIFNDVNNLIQSGVLHSSIINGISNTIESGAKERNNIYGGFSNSITSGNDNIIIGGANNEIFGSNSIVVGGGFNYSSGITQKSFTHFGYLLGDYSSLIGGTSNSIFGGEQNLILGGNINNISKSAPTGINTIVNSWKSNILDSARTNLIIGGAYHASSGDYQTIINGYTNKNYGRYSNIFNGYNNTISGSYSTILNGQSNSIESSNSAVLHGSNNYIYENNGVVIGNKNYIGHSGAVLISDSTSRIKNSQAENSLSLDFTNGVYLENDVSIYNLRLRNRKYTDYSYKTSNFVFSTYMNIVNSSSTINALLPNVEDSRNFFVKNINSGALNITSTHLIDGQSSLTLYKNESVEFMGIIKYNYTGWIVVGGNGGIN